MSRSVDFSSPPDLIEPAGLAEHGRTLETRLLMDRFAERRSAFMESIDDGIALIPAASEVIRNRDVPHPFRQDSDFYFLTGFPEPDALALFDPRHETERYILFVRPRDPEQEAWDGKRAGVDGAMDSHGADAAYPVGDLDRILRDRFRGRETLFYQVGRPTDAQVLGALRRARSHQGRSGIRAPHRIEDPTHTLAEMRLVKSPPEIDAMREACRISAAGHVEAMRTARPGLSERTVQAAMEHVFRASGAEREGYPSIVASGPNAVILHYVDNDRMMEDGDLLLIDAAAEIGYMSSDITRTFPVNGRFTPAQRDIYDVVLTAEEAAIDLCVPGTAHGALHDTAVRVLTEGMVEMGLLPGPVEDAIEFGWYREFFFHGTSHWLGLDVHDAGDYKLHGLDRVLVPGMVFTVEPGIYVAPHKRSVELARAIYDPDADRDLSYLEGAQAATEQIAARRAAAEQVIHDVPERFLGIGVRLEDDLLIIADGFENLTRGVPVDPDEIEAICSGDAGTP